MAMIGKIRNQSNLVIIVIALGMLLFLVPWNSFLALIGAGQYEDRGEMNGTSISPVEYEQVRLVRSETFNYTSGTQLNNAVWDDLTQKYILAPEYADLGIDVTEEEWDAMMFGDYVPQAIKSVFYQQGVTPEAKDNWQQSFELWASDPNPDNVRIHYNGRREIARNMRRKEKWDQLIDRGVYFNSIDGKHEYKLKNDQVDIDYVFVKYDEIADSLITYDEGDIRAYYNRHKDEPKYYQRRERDIEYVEFKVTPSEKDSSMAKSELSALASEWRKTTEDGDSLFVVTKGGVPSYRPTWYLGGEQIGNIDTLITKAQGGEVFGPYKPTGNQNFRLTKVLRTAVQPDSAEVRHVLFGLNDNPDLTMDDLRERADSVRREIQAGRLDFETAVTEFSDDPGSVSKGGVYEMFGRNNQFVAPFSDASFENSVGDLVLVPTQFGIHLIEITKQVGSSRKVQIVDINKPVEASSETKRQLFEEARQFSLDYGTSEAFTMAADSLGLPLKTANAIQPGTGNVPGLGAVGNLVTWAYQSKDGDVSGAVSTQNGQSYVVAHLLRSKEKGTPPFEYVKDKMEEGLVKELKFELYKQKMASGTLEEIATAAGTTVKKANAINMNGNTIKGSGDASAEFEAVGLCFGLTTEEISTPIQGDAGIFVLAPRSEVRNSEDIGMYLDEQDKLMTSARSRAKSANELPATQTGVYGSMKRKAGIEDKRFQY